jgi:hypothetical protein
MDPKTAVEKAAQCAKEAADEARRELAGAARDEGTAVRCDAGLEHCRGAVTEPDAVILRGRTVCPPCALVEAAEALAPFASGDGEWSAEADEALGEALAILRDRVQPAVQRKFRAFADALARGRRTA